MATSLRNALVLLLCAGLAACSLPRGAGVERELLNANDAAEVGYAVYPVTRAFLPSFSQWPSTGERQYGWIGASAGSNGRVIQTGDSVQIVIWDSSDNSLLMSPGQRQVVMPDMRVSPSGSVFLPYVGAVRIAGISPESARARVQDAIAGVAPAAQAQLSLNEGRSNSVDLVGGVTTPGPYPLPDNNYTVLSLISAGGGVRNGMNNPQITLRRGNRTYATSIDRLYEEPGLDTRLLGGDKVIVEEDDRYFLSIGAAGQENTHAFTRDGMSALDAIAVAGGVNDNRADPEGVLILREYPDSALGAGQRGPRENRVVFTIDLTEADGLFSARKFEMHSGDVIYVSESPVSSLETVFGLVGRVFGIARTVQLTTDD